MSELPTFDILAVGGVDADLVLTVDHLPTFDEKVIGRLVGRLPGGPAANSACAASRLGLRVAALATVGDDEAAQIIINGYTEFGVDTSLVEVAPDATSPFTVILIDPTGEKAIVVVPGSRPRYPMERVEQALRRSRAMYMMPGDQAQFLELAQLAQACGAEVMIDVESTVGFAPATLARLLAPVDIASFNQDGFIAASGEQPSPEALRRLLDYGPHTVVVTRGAQGAMAVTADQAAEVPGYRMEVARHHRRGRHVQRRLSVRDVRRPAARPAAALCQRGCGALGHPTSGRAGSCRRARRSMQFLSQSRPKVMNIRNASHL